MTRTLRKIDERAKQILDELVTTAAQIKVRRDRAEADRQEHNPALLAQMQQAGVRTHRVPWSDDQDAVSTIKRRDNTRIDPERLKKAIGAKAFHKLTTAHLDDAKVDAAIQLGELDPNVVAQCMEGEETEFVETRFLKARSR